VAVWNPSTPWPVACPGSWSLTNKYSGIPAYVTCVPPSGREIVPSSLALTPFPAVAELTPAGKSKGGHVVAHESVHMIVPPLSDANSYSVNPLESTSTVPAPGTDFVPMMTEPACALVELPPSELGAAFLAQADNAISATAEAIQTRRAVPVDDFIFCSPQGRGSRARPTLFTRVFATGNTVGSQVRFIPAAKSQSSMSWPSPRIGQEAAELGADAGGGDVELPTRRV
jgi:hypothetical protein